MNENESGNEGQGAGEGDQMDSQEDQGNPPQDVRPMPDPIQQDQAILNTTPIPYNIGDTQVLIGFKSYLQSQRLSPFTIKQYVIYVSKFLDQIHYDLSAINEQAFTYFFESVKSSFNPLIIFSIKKFCDYIESNAFNQYKKKYKRHMKDLAMPRRIVLNYSDIRRIIDILPYPFKIMAMIQWDTGMRVGAILRMNCESFNVDDDGYFYINSIEKGSKRVTKFISKETGILIGEYLERLGKTQGLMFPLGLRYKTAHMKYETALRRYAGMLGIEITSHAIRRSRAVSLIRQGENIITVKNFLGHVNPAITFKDIEFAGQESKDIIKKDEKNRV